MNRLFAVLLMLVVMAAAQASAQTASGEVVFTGAGAAELPTTTFLPVTHGATEGSWAFFDELEEITLVVVEYSPDPTQASFVSVSLTDGSTWSDLDLTGMPGVTHVDRTITFEEVRLVKSAAKSAELILNGSVTWEPGVRAERSSWGRVRALFGR